LVGVTVSLSTSVGESICAAAPTAPIPPAEISTTSAIVIPLLPKFVPTVDAVFDTLFLQPEFDEDAWATRPLLFAGLPLCT
jgi:hypothetical protein